MSGTGFLRSLSVVLIGSCFESLSDLHVLSSFILLSVSLVFFAGGSIFSATYLRKCSFVHFTHHPYRISIYLIVALGVLPLDVCKRKAGDLDFFLFRLLFLFKGCPSLFSSSELSVPLLPLSLLSFCLSVLGFGPLF